VSVARDIEQAVARHLATELGDRGLLLTADALAAAEAGAAQQGTQLLNRVVRLCYPGSRQEEAAITIEFESERGAARMAAALVFGAATARVLAPAAADSTELMCGMFNLGIGLIDGLCDGDAAIGGALLEIVQQQDPAEAAAEPRPRGWLRAAVPASLAADPTVAFTVEVVEAFFETLHTVYPDEQWLQHRRAVGAQLGAALEAERRSVLRSADETPEQLIECSRLTSVLPFEIIEALAEGAHARTEPAAGTQLGEAMWRIDDLVDLCQDAHSGSLNGVLLGAARPGDPDFDAALERLLASTGIAHAAAEAAEKLEAGLQQAGGHATPFLYFIQRYAGIS
jgi:hypothetical protein